MKKKKSTVQGQANPSIHALVIQVVLRVNIQTRYIKLICEFIFVFKLITVFEVEKRTWCLLRRVCI